MENTIDKLDWSVKTLQELDSIELYQLLKLRADVFIIEQDCIYPDMDGKDVYALHVLGKKDNEVIAYARIFDAGGYFEEASLGRVVVKESERKFKYGHELIRHTLIAIESKFGIQPVNISAQQYLVKFYETHGFETFGEGYLEDGIPHVGMLRP